MFKRKRIVLTIAIIVVLLSAGIAVYKLVIGGSATGTISTSQTITQAAVTPTTLIAEQGTYASFNYPSLFHKEASDPPVAPVLVNYNFAKSQFQSWQLAIQISQLDSGDINDNASYHYRKITTSQYVFSSVTINSKAVPIVTDKTEGGYNQVAFLVQGTKIATISLSGGASGQDDDAMDAALKTILSSWQWL